MITAIVNTKGGAGKSLIALNLAVAAAETGLSVLLIDADGQHALTRAFVHRQNSILSGTYSVQPIDIKLILDIQTLKQELEDACTNYDEIIIDSAGFDMPYVWQIVGVSETILVPVNAGMTDVEITAEIATKLIYYSNQYVLAENFKCRCISNSYKKNSLISGIVSANLSMLDEILPKLETPFSQRPTYPNAFAHGLGAIEKDPKCEAAKEVRRLYTAIKQSLV